MTSKSPLAIKLQKQNIKSIYENKNVLFNKSNWAFNSKWAFNCGWASHTHTHKANTNLSPFRNFRTSADYSSAVWIWASQISFPKL